eukprot:1999955-Amphidinium_carterae.2
MMLSTNLQNVTPSDRLPMTWSFAARMLSATHFCRVLKYMISGDDGTGTGVGPKPSRAVKGCACILVVSRGT